MTATDDTDEPGARTVLVIDDEDYVAALIESALEGEGYTVSLAFNGRDGLALAQTRPVDLVIVDIMMPYINGLALVDRLRKLDRTRSVPIILISARSRPHELPPGVRFLSKPFDIDRLLEMVASSLKLPT